MNVYSFILELNRSEPAKSINIYYLFREVYMIIKVCDLEELKFLPLSQIFNYDFICSKYFFKSFFYFIIALVRFYILKIFNYYKNLILLF